MNKGRKGIAVIITAASLVGILPIVGLAIDAGLMYAVKARLSAAADAAALAAARSLARGLTLGEQEASAIARAHAFFNANFPEGYYATTGRTVNVSVAETAFRTRTVTVNAQVHAPTYFMRILNLSGADIVTMGRASRRDVNLIMVLDRSSSMANSNSCTPMKTAAQKFVDQFANTRDRIGMIAYGASWSLGLDGRSPDAFNFKTISPNLSARIGTINCFGNTSSAMALSEAYNQLVAINEPGALNLIVFFTDGLPNGVTADYPVKLATDTRYGYSGGPCGTGSTCSVNASTCTWTNTSLAPPRDTRSQAYNLDDLGASYSSPNWNPLWYNAPDPNYPAGDPNTWRMFRRGVVAQWNQNRPTGDTAGVVQPGPTALSASSEPAITNRTGCQWGPGTSNLNRVRRDIAYMPNQDVYGNRTDCCYKTVETVPNGAYAGFIRIDKPSSIGKASANAADNAAARARNDARLGVVIYSIGLGDPTGTEPPDDVFMRRVANDPSSPIYDPDKPQGLYVFAPNNTQLNQAFARVASEILRIAL